MHNLLKAAGFNSNDELRDAIISRLHADGVKLSEFNDAQKREIIKTYAAAILAA